MGKRGQVWNLPLRGRVEFNPDMHHRKSIRLRGYDYSQAGLYFVTICTQNRLPLFGEIVGAGSKPALAEHTLSKPTQMVKNEYGQIVENTWFDLVNHVGNIKLHQFVIMPNHIHGIIKINNDITGKPQPLAEIVRQFKTFSAKRINKLCGTGGNKIWQRNYYEHIIRSEQAYSKIAEYIETNPLKWPDDKYHV